MWVLLNGISGVFIVRVHEKAREFWKQFILSETVLLPSKPQIRSFQKTLKVQQIVVPLLERL